MRIVNLSSEADAILHAENPGIAYTIENYKMAIAVVRGKLTTDIELSSLAGVEYDTKTDRYVARFGLSGKSTRLKCTNDVAEFLTRNLRTVGSWQGRMEKGVLVDVDLVGY